MRDEQNWDPLRGNCAGQGHYSSKAGTALFNQKRRSCFFWQWKLRKMWGLGLPELSETFCMTPFLFFMPCSPFKKTQKTLFSHRSSGSAVNFSDAVILELLGSIC